MITTVPIPGAQRLALMDVLRGVALFGVFLVNLTQFASVNIMATEQQLLSLPTAPVDLTLFDLLEWGFVDKANTVFAFLFGLGFYLQMQRMESRGADFERLYRRRLAVLLVIGILNVVFLWAWDILHLYALAGFVLLSLRRLGNRDLVAIGLICAVLGRIAQEALVEFGGLTIGSAAGSGYDEPSVLVRQQLSASGDYLGLVGNFLDWTVVSYLFNGLIIGWFFYALGRFLIGAWVGRHGWISRAREFLPGWRRVMSWTLPGGLLIEGCATLISQSTVLPEWEHRGFIGEALHLIAVPVLATGYVSGIVVAFHGRIGARLLAPFAWSGRMALTNYLAQGLVIAFVLFGVGPGLGLAGRIGTAALLAIVVVIYAVQIVFSWWWLQRFAFGPVEWLWRALTYGERPEMRLRPSVHPAAD